MVAITVAALIIIGVLLFELIILAHEFGHFITAKLSGVKVNGFALGMGPKIIKFTKGETEYSLRLFPIGGACEMEGEDEESDNERSFTKKAIWKRMIIVISGCIMNILLGLIMMLIIVAQRPATASTTIGDFVELPDTTVKTSDRLKPGDMFHSIEDYRIYTSRDIGFALVLMNTNKPDITVERDGKLIELKDVELPSKKSDNPDAQTYENIQIDFRFTAIERSFLNTISLTFKESVSIVRMVWGTLAGMFTGRFGLNDVSGPVGIVETVSQVAGEGLKTSFLEAFNSILLIMMIISINLGVVNMMPIPALDGGRFFFMLIELIFRKPIPTKYEGYVHAAGMVILLSFMAIVTVKDVLKLILG